MTTTQKAVALAALMIGIAVLAVFEIIPEQFAQFGPMALLAMFPGIWLGRSSRCARGC
ncbi:hypothetical protein [Erythrobacter mangrovi]|uniref:Uncharacterized protein n=1 Tax=Erythrobacter mangrovi TaxID=2739433 RepID=A0A7D3XAS4_9SPHN|nr:hypothetical protein [Erythrobacter mangrovi]QKG70800.1 hypothetical protein HQR01_05115 [Erythrobacter mangrovi]